MHVDINRTYSYYKATKALFVSTSRVQRDRIETVYTDTDRVDVFHIIIHVAWYDGLKIVHAGVAKDV